MQTTIDSRRFPDTELDFDTEQLVEEIRAYLDAIDLFRHEDCEPDWKRERA